MKKNWAALASPVILHCTTFSGLCNKHRPHNYILDYKKTLQYYSYKGCFFFYLKTRTTIVNIWACLFFEIIANFIPGIFSYRLVSISGIKVDDEGSNRNSLQNGPLKEVEIGEHWREKISQDTDQDCSCSTAGWEASITGHHASHIGGDSVSGQVKVALQSDQSCVRFHSKECGCGVVPDQRVCDSVKWCL